MSKSAERAMDKPRIECSADPHDACAAKYLMDGALRGLIESRGVQVIGFKPLRSAMRATQ
jgi:hypothetical protein